MSNTIKYKLSFIDKKFNKIIFRAKGEAITPIPKYALNEVPIHYQLGDPAQYWCYTNEQGEPLLFNCRFILDDGKKDDRPLTYHKFDDGSEGWQWKSLSAPRPLYGLHRLSKTAEKPVLICEGEKAADAANVLFPDYVSITSINGSQSPHKSDWSALNGREVVIWPDNDDAGLKYAQSVAGIAKKEKAVKVSIVQVPDDFPEKWDLADEIPIGYSVESLQQLIANAEIYLDPLENLIERVNDDIGYAYTVEVINALADLKSTDKPEYARLRKGLKKAGAGITDIEKDMAKSLSDFESQDEKDHLDLAADAVAIIGQDNVMATNNDVHLWREDKGLWVKLSDKAINSIILDVLQNENQFVTRSITESVAALFKNCVYQERHEWNVSKEVINCLNGELYFNGDKWELLPANKEHYLTVQIPVNYDAQASAPRFNQFLNEIFAGDADIEQKKTVLLQMIGYSLVCLTKYERFMMLIGSGANGKSVILDLIKMLVGADNTSAVQPSQFSHKFQRAHLHGKLVNLVTEIAEGAVIADAELKSISSGELITAEHKGKDPFEFAPYCTCWFGTNHMPHTRDFSDGLFRRAIILQFNNQFKGKDADPNLKAKLAQELSGILNLALGAYADVIRQGYFNEPESSLKAKSEWRTEADQVKQFIDEACQLDPELSIPSDDLYRSYLSWADDAGVYKRLGRRGFINRLVNYGCKPYKGTNGTRMIKGLRAR